MHTLAHACIIGLFVLIIVFYTPTVLSHRAWTMRIRRAYQVDGESGYRYVCYSHETTDGARVLNRLKTGPLPPKLFFRPLPDQCDLWVRVRVHRRLNASPFLTLVAHFLKLTRRSNLLTGILVSTRASHLPLESRYSTKGCFVRTAYTECNELHDAQALANAHAESIVAIREASEACDTLAERARMLRCDYVFNKWMLDCIERDDGKTLRLHRGGIRVSLTTLLKVRMPLDLKCVNEQDDIWVLMATPLWMTLR